MVEDFAPWLSTMVANACAANVQDPAFAGRVLDRCYAPLLQKGRFPAPGAVIDLAHLFVEAEDALFEPPAWLKGEAAEGARRYCRFLNDPEIAPALHRAARRLKLARRMGAPDAGTARSAGFARPGPLDGLGCFIETAAPLLPALGTPAGASDLYRRWPATLDAVLLSARADDAAARHAIEAFFLQCARDGFGDYDEVLTLLAIAATRAERGDTGVDLPLLDSCLRYAPPDDDDVAARRRVMSSVRPRDDRSTRAREVGTHGIGRSGSITSVLRSFLARDDFEERLVRHELLYLQRHAPKLEPVRVLVAFILECGPAMRVRAAVTGVRRSLAGRRLVARLLEDVVRRTAEVPALDLRPALVLHNGRDGAESRQRVLFLTARESANLAAAVAGPESWLPHWRLFMPTFFMNDVGWDAPQDRPNGESGVARCLLTLRAAFAGLDVFQSASTGAFDLAFAVVVGDGSLDHPDGDGASRPSQWLRSLSTLAAAPVLHSLRAGDDGFAWDCLPSPVAEPTGVRRLFGYDADAERQVRRVLWDDLVSRLGAL
jgi:hypothetical protein